MEKIVKLAARELDYKTNRNELFDNLCQLLMVKVADWDNNNYFNQIIDNDDEVWLRFNKCRLNYKLSTEQLGMFRDYKLGQNMTLKLIRILDDIDFDAINYDPFSKLWNHCITHHNKKSDLGQFHTPYNVVKMMVEMELSDKSKEDAPLKLIDPTCGVGTMQTVAWREHPELFDPMNSIFGVDIDYISVLGARYSFAAWGLNPHNVVCGDGLIPLKEHWPKHVKKIEEKLAKMDHAQILEDIEEINKELEGIGCSLKGS